MINASTEDPQQEYMCIPTSGRDSIFGMVTKDDKQGMSEWLDDDEEEESDIDWDKSDKGDK